MSRADVATWLAEHSGRTTAQLAAVGKDFVKDKRVRFPGNGDNPDEFQPTIAPGAESKVLVAVAGSRNAGISMVTKFFADWSGTATPIETPNA